MENTKESHFFGIIGMKKKKKQKGNKVINFGKRYAGALSVT